MAESTLNVYESKFGDAKFINRESVYSSEDESKIPDLEEFKIFISKIFLFKNILK